MTARALPRAEPEPTPELDAAAMVRALFDAGAVTARVKLRERGRTWEIEATRGDQPAPRRVMRAE